MDIKTVNPTTEEMIKSYSLFSAKEINERIDAAHEAYNSWRLSRFVERSELMYVLVKLLRQNQDDYAKLMAVEMGKPIVVGRAEIEKCAWVCEHYANAAESYLAPKSIKTEAQKSLVCYQPLGIVFAIMPWNFPFWQVFRFAAPTIMAGNGAILKHAPITTGCGEVIADLFLKAGFPKHLFQHFLLDNDKAAAVIAHEKIIGVTLTGSGAAGRVVAANAAQHLKKSVLELGGNDAYIVLADACIDVAARCIVASRLSNTGQVCIAAKRIIVVHTLVKELIGRILELLPEYNLGDPLDEHTRLGPLAREDLRAKLHAQVLESQRLGAKILVGGEIPNRRGYYYPPTILTNVSPGMPAFDEELFGPVISITIADNEKEAIQLANQSQYGLGSAVFTKDLKRGEQIATNEIEAGACFVNGVVTSDPRLPFGGIKESGFGRELSQEGILEFMNIKTVVIRDE